MSVGKRIGDLDRQTSFELDDLLLIERSGITKSATIAALKAIMKGEQGAPGKDGGGATINDGETSITTVWSGHKTHTEIEAVINKLKYIPEEYIRGMFSKMPSKSTPTNINDLLNRGGLDILVEEVNKYINSVSTRVEDTITDIYSQVSGSQYQTVQGSCTVTSSKDCYIDNVGIVGKTVVSIAKIKGKNYNSTLNDAIRTRFDTENGGASIFNHRITNGTYTLYNFTDKIINFPQLTKEGSWTQSFNVEPNSYKVVEIGENGSLPGVDFWFRDGWTQSDLDTVSSEMFMVLEGSHESMPYMSGVRSIGQYDTIPIMTHSTSGKVDLSSVTFTNNQYVSGVTGLPCSDSTAFKYSNEYIEIEPGVPYLFKNVNLQFAVYNANKEVIPQMWENLKNLQIIRDNYQSTFCYTFPVDARFVRINVPVPNMKPFSIYKNCEWDSKVIPTTLRSLSQCRDEIIKHNDRHYKIQKCKEKTINHKDDIILGGVNGEFILFRISVPDMALNRWDIMCDAFKVSGNYTVSECIFGEDQASIGRYIYISIHSSKLDTPDLDGFRSWLTKNTVTVVYPLYHTRIIELGSLNLRIGSGESQADIITGSVQGEFSFSITNSLGSDLYLMKQQISQLTQVINSLMFSNDSHTSPKLTLLNVDDVRGEGSSIVFDNIYRDQSVQIRQNHFDSERKPFGIRIEKGESNTQRNLKAYLDVEGLIYTEDGVVIGGTQTLPTEVTKIRSEGQVSGVDAISFYPVHQYGHGVRVGAGGLTIVGGGESTVKYVTELPDGGSLDTENTIITADNDIIIRSGCQTEFTEDRKSVFHRNGGMSVGTSSGNVKKTTISYAQPSGGSGGDIWLSY